MKELSIEQKAQRYDDAINAIKELKENHPTALVIKDWVNENFPELAESKDERIINRIKKAVENYWSDEPLNDIITWLEKQGEHTNFRNKIQVGDKVTRNQDGMLVNLSQLKRVAKKDEKQGEQKPAWSEEDNIILSRIIADYERSNEEWFNAQNSLPHGRKINWLKSLKDRIQPKQEWSEEDEKMFKHIIAKATLHFSSINYLDEEEINFLKSLRPQNTWKPSGEQMKQLGKYCPDNTALTALYEYLKQL